MFSSEGAACTLAEKASSDAEGIDFGIRAEKDSILFYTELQDLVRRADAKVIGKIIEEERSHLKRLSDVEGRSGQSLNSAAWLAARGAASFIKRPFCSVTTIQIVCRTSRETPARPTVSN